MLTFFFCLFQITDDQIPLFNEWEDSSDRIISINGRSNDAAEDMEELLTKDPPSLTESLELVRRLRLLSTTQQPEFHSLIIQLQSKLTGAFLSSNSSKERFILEYFKYS